MTARVLLALLLWTVPAIAQLQLFLAPPVGVEQIAPAIHDMGQVAVAESASVRFRIRNMGTAPVSLAYLYIAGSGFSVSGAPSLPYLVAAGVNVDFTVRFTPLNSSTYSANLTINSSSYIVRGTGLPGAAFRVNGEDLQSGAATDLGRVERGNSSSIAASLVNASSEAVTIGSITVAGTAFSLAGLEPGPVTLKPTSTVSFEIRFNPSASGISTGLLTIDRRTFRLTGTAFEPPLPRPLVIIETPAVRSAEQGRVSIRLASPSKSFAKGQLRMELRPAGRMTDNDAAAQFVNGSRSVAFDISPGDEVIKLRGENAITFSTGTTAGTIVFVVEAGGFNEQAVVGIPAEQVRLDKATGARAGSSLEVTLAGFDNTRSLSELSFTFYSNGQPMAGMPVKISATADFGRWWSASTLGGIFQLKAAFPVTGDISKITGVDMQMTSSSGPSAVQRITF